MYHPMITMMMILIVCCAQFPAAHLHFPSSVVMHHAFGILIFRLSNWQTPALDPTRRSCPQLFDGP